MATMPDPVDTAPAVPGRRNARARVLAGLAMALLFAVLLSADAYPQ